jgi:uncharacterized membrane protein YtjA (UPF0391 family)
VPRLITVILVCSFVAAAVGFGDFAGVPSQVVFIARIIAAVCLLLVVSVAIASFRPAENVSRRPPRDHRPQSREPR